MLPILYIVGCVAIYDEYVNIYTVSCVAIYVYVYIVSSVAYTVYSWQCCYI